MANEREWSYWTRRKLAILENYLKEFTKASANKSTGIIYIDLMSGGPQNRERHTRELFDGSFRIAMDTVPKFTRLAFIERDEKVASAIRQDLATRYGNDSRARVYAGDCNEKIDDVIRDLAAFHWAPTFVFIDQQSADVTWSTISKLANFKQYKTKPELWILISAPFMEKGAKGTKNDEFRVRIDALYGTSDWLKIQSARDSDLISAEEYRDHMVNFFRWRLQTELGYQATMTIPIYMGSSLAIYEMVFATDHPAGISIMNSVYQKSDALEPGLRRQFWAHIRSARERIKAPSLFDINPDWLGDAEIPKWSNSPAYDLSEFDWWKANLGDLTV